MKCDKCGNSATYFSSYNINGNYSENALCADCAKIEGKISSENKFNFKNFFDSIESSESYKCIEFCSVCGSSAEEILQSGYVGCDNCYNAFRNMLYPMIKKFHNNIKHLGKVPNKAKSPNEQKLEKLYTDLEKAVSERRYEDAVTIDIEIRKLEKYNGN